MSKIALTIVVDLALSLALSVALGTAFMLLMGVLHADVSPAVPPIGFGPSYVIALLVGWCYQLLTVHTFKAAVGKS